MPPMVRKRNTYGIAIPRAVHPDRVGLTAVRPTLPYKKRNRHAVVGSRVQPIFCKDSANRTQSSLLEIAEVQPIFCKDNKYMVKPIKVEMKNTAPSFSRGGI